MNSKNVGKNEIQAVIAFVIFLTHLIMLIIRHGLDTAKYCNVVSNRIEAILF